MNSDVERVLITEEQINVRISELARDISEFYKGEPVVVVSILKGGAVFTVDLIKRLNMDVMLDFACVSSYGSETVSSGELIVKKDIDIDIKNKNVLIAEDIIDTGITLSKLRVMLQSRGAKDVKIVTMLNKQARRKIPINADFVGFDIPDEFVVGYGLDYDERYRNLPYVGVLSRSVYEKSE